MHYPVLDQAKFGKILRVGLWVEREQALSAQASLGADEKSTNKALGFTAARLSSWTRVSSKPLRRFAPYRLVEGKIQFHTRGCGELIHKTCSSFRLGLSTPSSSHLIAKFFDCQRDRVSAAQAQCGHAAPGIAAVHFVEQGYEDARAGGSYGVA